MKAKILGTVTMSMRMTIKYEARPCYGCGAATATAAAAVVVVV